MGKRIVIAFLLLNSLLLFSRSFYLKKEGDFRLNVYLTQKSGIRLQVKTAKKIPLSKIKKIFSDKKNPKITYRKVLRTKYYYFRFEDLKPDYKAKILKKLFPKDRIKGNYYIHKVRYSEESLWRLAVWFTEDGMNYKKIKKINKLKSNTLYRGAYIKIPVSLLASYLKPKSSKPKQRKEEKKQNGGEKKRNNSQNPNTSSKPVLEYGKDKYGKFAVYRLKKGEALYSAVVVRFTGRLDAKSVLDLASKIAKRSGIKDVTDIPIGYPIKIPLEYLLPEYLPKDSKEYKSYVEDLKESEILADKFSIEKSPDLEGVYVILDSGHGGADTGAMYNGVWEDDYMYDIVCRVKRLLEKKTKAMAIPIVYDKSSGYRVFDKKKLVLDRDEYLLTTPRFPLNSRRVTTMGLNLRWYIANYLNKKRLKSGMTPTKIVFISFHADALYRKVRGAMIYIPYAGLYRKKAGYRSRSYLKYYEVRVNPVYRFTKKEVQISEGLSRKFAFKLIKNLEREKIPIHKEKPVREFIFRSKYSRPFVPAVLRYNKVMVKMLVEVGNLKNKKDAKNIADPNFREKFAKAVVNSLIDFYSKK